MFSTQQLRPPIPGVDAPLSADESFSAMLAGLGVEGGGGGQGEAAVPLETRTSLCTKT